MARIIILLISWLAMAASSLWSLACVYVTAADFSHDALVPAFAAYAAWRIWPRARTGGARWPGVPAFAAGAALMLLGSWYDIAFGLAGTGSFGPAFLQGAGAVLSLAGLCAVAGGWRMAVAWAFPLLFLLFAVPLPQSLVTHATLPLQRVSALCAEWVLRTGGVVVFREGNLLHLGGGTLGVTEACSGLRSIYVLITASVAFAWLCRLRILPALGALALVPVLVVASNTLRIVVSGVFVQLGRMDWVTGSAHDILGLITTALAAWLLFLVALRGRRPAGPPPEEVTPRAPLPGWGWVGVLAVTALTGALIEGGVRLHYDRAAPAIDIVSAGPRRPLADFPRALGAFEAVEDGTFSQGELTALGPTDWLKRFYRGPNGETAAVTLLYWGPYRAEFRGRGAFHYPHSPDICYPGAGWRHEKEHDTALRFESMPDEVVYVRHFVRAEARVAMVFWMARGYTDPRAWFSGTWSERWRDLRASWRSPRRAVVPPRYGVYVTVMGQGETDAWPALRAAAIALAERVAKEVADFGFKTVPGTNGETAPVQPVP